MAKEQEYPPYWRECGRRLRRVRKAMGYKTIRALVDETGDDEDSVGHWERGKHLVKPDYLLRVYNKTGVAVADWVYLDVADNLPVRVDKALRASEPKVGHLQADTED